MVVDSLNNCELYENLHRDFPKVFEILQQIAKGEITNEINLVDGCVWVNAPTEVNEITEQRLYEAHKDFIDIHYIISGVETFGYSNIDRLKTIQEYDKENDCEMLDGNKDFITLKAGDFCIVFPQDAHIPFNKKIGTDKLVRVVAKVKI